MQIYLCITGIAFGSFILGLVLGNMAGKKSAYQQMTLQGVQNDVAKLWTNLFTDMEDDDVSQKA